MNDLVLLSPVFMEALARFLVRIVVSLSYFEGMALSVRLQCLVLQSLEVRPKATLLSLALLRDVGLLLVFSEALVVILLVLSTNSMFENKLLAFLMIKTAEPISPSENRPRCYKDG